MRSESAGSEANAVNARLAVQKRKERIIGVGYDRFNPMGWLRQPQTARALCARR